MKKYCRHLMVVVFMLFLAMGFFSVHASGIKMPRYSVTGFIDAKNRCGNDLNSALVLSIQDPKVADWKQALSFYDFSKSLPDPSDDELYYEEGFISKKKIHTKFLPALFEGIYNRKFTDAKYGLRDPADISQQWLRSFGDIMAHFRGLRGKGSEAIASLKGIEKNYPAIWQEVREILPDLVKSDFLYSTSWEPWKEESASGKGNDGMIFLPYWIMKENPKRDVVWNKNLGEHKVIQGGVVIYATLDQIKSTERNLKQYLDYVGMGYYAAAPLANSYWRGVDQKGDEFIALQSFFCQELPFPYKSSKYAMKLLDFYNAKGFYVSDYYSDNRADLNWMAGRDTFYPLRTSSGEFIGYLIATELDFDIKGLPERVHDRIVSVRGTWGNIKLISEGYGILSKAGSSPGKVSSAKD